MDRWHKRYDDEVVSQDVSNGAVTGGISSKHLIIKRDELKYCHYGEDAPEVLFDLDRDPEETTNIAANLEYADSMRMFRTRRAELVHGPDANPTYTTAGYEAGVAE